MAGQTPSCYTLSGPPPPPSPPEAGSETYYAPKGRKTLPLWTQPAPPSEVTGPLGRAVTVGSVAAGAPLFAVSSLRGADGVDDTAVKFLLRAGLKKKKEEEAQMAQDLLYEIGAPSDASSSSHPMRRKKKRKKKTAPKTSSSRFSGLQLRRCGQWLRYCPSISLWCSSLALGIVGGMDQKERPRASSTAAEACL